MSQWYIAADDLIAGWPHSGQNARKDQVSLGAQETGVFFAHPLPMRQSIRTVGFIRPLTSSNLSSKFTSNSLTYIPLLDYIGLPDGSALGEENYDEPVGIG